MYKPCGADSLISILKGSGKHYVYSGDSQSEMRLTGIVSHKMPRKGEDFPQAAGSTAPFLQTFLLLFSESGLSIPAQQDVWEAL